MKFKWPNEFIGRDDGVSPTYDELTFTELVYGLIAGLVDQLPRQRINRYILDQLLYLRELFKDSTSTALSDTKTCHRIVLESLEKGDLDPTCWEDWNVKHLIGFVELLLHNLGHKNPSYHLLRLLIQILMSNASDLVFFGIKAPVTRRFLNMK